MVICLQRGRDHTNRFLESLRVIYTRNFDVFAGLSDGKGRGDEGVVVVVVVKGEEGGNQDKEPLAPDSGRQYCTGPSGVKKNISYTKSLRSPGIVPI